MTITVPVNDRFVRFVAAAAQTVFDTDFPVLVAEHVEVWRERAGTASKINPGDYVVSQLGAQAGARVTLNTGSLVGDIVVLRGAMPAERATNFLPDTLKSDGINTTENRLQMQAQELRRDVDRALSPNAIGDDRPYDAKAKRITGLANASGATDAVPKGQLDTLLAPITTEVAAAAATAVAAAASVQGVLDETEDLRDETEELRDQTLASYVQPGSPTPLFEHVVLDSLEGQFNGVTLVFDLEIGGEPFEPNSAAQLLMFINSIYQRPGTVYSVDGHQLTFITGAPAAGDRCSIVALKNTFAAASDVAFAPEGELQSVTVQEALEELDTEKQPRTTALSALGAVTPAADKLPYFTSGSAAALVTLSAFIRTLLPAVDAAAALLVLGAAPLASPGFTGTPTAPNVTAGDSTTKIANTAFVMTAIANLVASSPGTLDTLNELAAALGNDPNFATTISTALGNRLRFDAGQSLSGGQKTQAYNNLGIASFVQGLLDDADAATFRASLGLRTLLLDDISGGFNGSATVFGLAASSVAVTPRSPYGVLVNFNGILQRVGVAVTISGSNITFTTAPVSGDWCQMILLDV